TFSKICPCFKILQGTNSNQNNTWCRLQSFHTQSLEGLSNSSCYLLFSLRFENFIYIDITMRTDQWAFLYVHFFQRVIGLSFKHLIHFARSLISFVTTAIFNFLK